MKQHKYIFNPSTLSFERVENGIKYWLKKSGQNILIGLGIGVLFFFLFWFLFPSPREKQLMQQKKALEAQLELLDGKVDQMQLVMNDLAQRDDNLYRVIFQADPISANIRQGATRKMQYYDELETMSNSKLAATLSHKIDVLEHEIYVQSKSYDDIVNMTKNQEIKMENMPAIQPILNKDLTHIASGFGWRIDPVYHTKRFHSGMDFTAPTGTEVFATGCATVSFVGWQQGYGNVVELNHGYGYMTRYAHLSRPLVRPGQKVKRGDHIALVGNTGKSTGPHLHYEVHLNGTPVDPRNYYFNDLSPEQYDQMVQLANNFGQMLD